MASKELHSQQAEQSIFSIRRKSAATAAAAAAKEESHLSMSQLFDTLTQIDNDNAEIFPLIEWPDDDNHLIGHASFSHRDQTSRIRIRRCNDFIAAKHSKNDRLPISSGFIDFHIAALPLHDINSTTQAQLSETTQQEVITK
jgi:hypothetical protein